MDDLPQRVSALGTHLTDAIIRSLFAVAENIITSSEYNASILNEGPPGMTPIALVLCKQLWESDQPMNMKLLRLLVHRGADIHSEIPVCWHDFTRPLSEVVVFYIKMSYLCRKKLLQKEPSGKDETIHAIGLNGEENLSLEEQRDHTLRMIDVLLCAGADSNMAIDIDDRTILHLVLGDKQEPFLDLVNTLCEAGADINRTDSFGRSPLMELIGCGNTDKAVTLMRYFWERSVVPDIWKCDCDGRNILWEAMATGNTALAIDFCSRGVSQSDRARIETCYWWRSAAVAMLSPIFAPFLKNSGVYAKLDEFRYKGDGITNVNLLAKVLHSAVAPVVDAGFLNTREVQDELETLICKKTNFHQVFKCKTWNRSNVIPLMFGNFGAGLKQRCVRAILSSVVSERVVAGHKSKQPIMSIMNSMQKSRSLQLKPRNITALMKDLRIPASLKKFFMIEGAKIQLGAALYQYTYVKHRTWWT